MVRAWLAGPLIFLIVGCDRGPVMVPVRGAVTYDAKPVADGTISFTHEDHPEWGPDAGVIKDGAYSLMAKLGKARVAITGNRPISDPAIIRKSGGIPPREDFIPAKHHSASQRTIEITGPKTDLNFDLER